MVSIRTFLTYFIFLMTLAHGFPCYAQLQIENVDDVILNGHDLRVTHLRPRFNYENTVPSYDSFVRALVADAETLREQEYSLAHPGQMEFLGRLFSEDRFDDGKSDIILVHEGPWKKLIGVLRITTTQSLEDRHPSEKMFGLHLRKAPEGTDTFYLREAIMRDLFPNLFHPSTRTGNFNVRNYRWDRRELKSLVTSTDLPLGPLMFALAELYEATSREFNPLVSFNQPLGISMSDYVKAVLEQKVITQVSEYFATSSKKLKNYYLSLGFEEYDPVGSGGVVESDEKWKEGMKMSWFILPREKYLTQLLTVVRTIQDNKSIRWHRRSNIDVSELIEKHLRLSNTECGALMKFKQLIYVKK